MKVNQEETATKADDMYSSDKDYVIIAKKVLPILVRQAKIHKTIYYSDLAEEVGIGNPRNLNYPLGSIGNTLKKAKDKLGFDIPPIQALVVSKDSDMPGEGYFPFVDAINHKLLTSQEKREISDNALIDIYHFKKWKNILADLNLSELNRYRVPASVYGVMGSGESEEHKSLKQYIANNPGKFGASKKDSAHLEFYFPSCDAIDVAFRSDKHFIGVEAKSIISDEDDILRGLFQCVKYKALAEALCSVENTNCEVKIFLALEGAFPNNLVSYRNILKINVIDNLKEVETTSNW